MGDFCEVPRNRSAALVRSSLRVLVNAGIHQDQQLRVVLHRTNMQRRFPWRAQLVRPVAELRGTQRAPRLVVADAANE